MNKNSQGRKWQLTVNNPLDCGLTHDVLIGSLMQFKPAYYCLSDEIAETGTFHTHVFFFCRSPVRFQTVKNRFPIAHIESARGSVQENRGYVTKSGKWEDTAKAETTVEGSFYEWGEIPDEKAENQPELALLIELIKDGRTNGEILQELPKMALQLQKIDYLRSSIMAEQNASEIRKLSVAYIFGATGMGKTSYVYSQHKISDVCRITSVKADNSITFDAYKGQDVLVFEEFHSQVKISDMLNYLDIWPVNLPARYNDRIAAYTYVYIISNLPLEAQYTALQSISPETWAAFLRRIHKVIEFQSDGTINEQSTDDYTGGLLYE